MTADVKTSLMELHDLGPCKLFDTAGLDEPGELGAKKRAKVCCHQPQTSMGTSTVMQARAACCSGHDTQGTCKPHA